MVFSKLFEKFSEEKSIVRLTNECKNNRYCDRVEHRIERKKEDKYEKKFL
jgi:hypothetical protein